MPIPTSTANAAVSIVSGLVRLAGRIDNIMAEQSALREDLALPGKVELSPPLASVMNRDLQTFLEETANQDPDPLGGRRTELAALVGQRNPAESALLAWTEELLPERIEYRIDDPTGDFAAQLTKRRSAWSLEDEEIRRLAYYLGPGEDLREARLPWQLATTVIGVLSEVAVQNQALIFRDDRARPILVSVLARFSEPDLATVGAHRTLLRFVLKATVNGALDAADVLGGDKAWVEGVLSGLAKAREASPQGDDFIIGLVQGDGYPLLIGSLLEEGAGLLSSSDAGPFEAVATDVLTRAGELVLERPDFEGFFREHWGDLLRAGLNSVHSNGNVILADEQPLLRQTLLTSIEVLATAGERDFLSREILTGAIEAAVGAIAVQPELLDDAVGEAWLREVLGSTAGVIADEGIRRAFSTAGLRTLMQTLLAEFARQPELLVARPGLAREVAGSMLAALAGAGKPRLEAVASAGVQAVLGALAADPGLVDTEYPALVAGVAGQLAVKLEDLRLTRGEAGEILRSIAGAIAADPALIEMDPTDLPATVVAELLGKLAEQRTRLVSSTTLKETLAAALGVLAADPRLLAGRPDLIREAVAPMLAELGRFLGESPGSSDQRLARLARAGLQGVLEALTRDPALLDSRYPAAVGKVAQALAERLLDGKLSAAEAEQILRLAAEIIASNPKLLVKEEDQLAALVLGAVLDKLLAEETLRLRGPDLVDLLAETLAVLAAHGKALLGDDSVDQLLIRVLVVIETGLDQANRELGRLLDRGTVPLVLAALLRRWALDRVETLDVTDPRFARLFEEIVSDVLARTL